METSPLILTRNISRVYDTFNESEELEPLCNEYDRRDDAHALAHELSAVEKPSSHGVIGAPVVSAKHYMI